MISSLGLQNFRSYTAESFGFSPRVTVISGPNGSGKTNILEAVHVAARGISFRGATSDEMRAYGATWWRLDMTANDTPRIITYDIARSGVKKRYRIRGNEKARLTIADYIPVVVFEPNDLRLLQGSPTRRRSFIDAYIAQIQPSYQAIINRYERALRQRNNLLKAPDLNEDNLFVWDMTLSELGGLMTHKRSQLIRQLNSHLGSVYNRVARTDKDRVSLAYVSRLVAEEDTTSPTGLQQRMLGLLHDTRNRDRLLGHTGVGPHRDDLAFFMNGHDAAVSASRGETRTIVLALKFIEIEQLLKTSDTPPLLLLDDVFSELDATRRQALLDVTSDCQIIITTTDADVVADMGLSEGTTHIRRSI